MTPFVFIIFGATGDLTRRKIVPALYNLAKRGDLDTPIYFVGVGRREISAGEFAQLAADAAHEAAGSAFDGALWSKMFSGFDYVQGDFDDPGVYDRVITVLEQFDKHMNACVPRFFYLATPPAHYETILTHLKDSKLSEGCGQGTNIYTRLLIEKPFGSDLTTARMLDKLLGSIFEERQIFRIDHYLGKETVQNMLAFRFANGMFEPTWNQEFIDHVQITLAEEGDIGTRGEFYDAVGALRDVVGSHMLEMLALIAMDQPLGLDAQSVRDARVKAMQSIDCIEPDEVPTRVIRGQYEGYLRESGVRADSQTETFVALKLFLTGERWKGVPFYLRAGKHMKQKVTEISIHYKKPVCATDTKGAQVCFFNPNNVKRNVLTFQISPVEGINLRWMVKKPGFGNDLAATKMQFLYDDAFGARAGVDAYERLLMDVIRGDMTLFARTDGIDASWTFITKILEGWASQKPAIFPYQTGSWGPKEADDMIARDDRHWFLPDEMVK